MAFYGDLFREPGKAAQRAYEPDDVTDTWECELLEEWWNEAARSDNTIQGPSDLGKARAPAFVQRALNALSRSRFFAGLAERAIIGDLKQVDQYMNNEVVRSNIQARLVDRISLDTRCRDLIFIGLDCRLRGINSAPRVERSNAGDPRIPPWNS